MDSFIQELQARVMQNWVERFDLLSSRIASYGENKPSTVYLSCSIDSGEGLNSIARSRSIVARASKLVPICIYNDACKHTCMDHDGGATKWQHGLRC